MRDELGNELKQGDLVVMTMGNGMIVRGRIQSIAEGGIITGRKQGGQGVRPAAVEIIASFTAHGQPGQPMANVMRLLDPNPTPAEESEAESKSKLIELPN